MLEARRLHFGHGAIALGRELDLTIGEGEALCLIGPNGAGKTTLLKTMLGLIPPIGGEVLLYGAPLSRLPRCEVAKRLGYVPQAHNALFPFSVSDVVLMGRAARIGVFETPSSADRAVVEEALDRLGIADLAGRAYTELSGGERQLVLIARALAQQPSCLVMDEPTANLDLANQARVLEVIDALKALGLAVVFSSHDPNHAFMCAVRVALMEEGALVAIGPPDDVMTGESLRKLYRVALSVEFSAGAGRKMCTPVRSAHGGDNDRSA